MRLYAKCENCKSDVNLGVTASDRFKLAKKRGEKINLICNSCGTVGTHHVNEIKAERSKTVSIVALLIFLGGTTGIFIYLLPYFFRTSYVYAISGLIGVLNYSISCLSGN